VLSEWKVDYERIKGEESSMKEECSRAKQLAEKAYEEKRELFEHMQGEIDLLKNQIQVLQVIHDQRVSDTEQKLRNLDFSYSTKLERLEHFE